MRKALPLISQRYTIIFAALLAMVSVASAYPVGPALDMDKLAAEADIIFKGTAISTNPLQDESERQVSGFVFSQTNFRLVSMLKGLSPGKTLQFRHYDVSRNTVAIMFMPQHYQFQANRTYIVFAKKTEKPGVYRHLWFNHNCKEDQGVLLCLDDKPLKAITPKEAFWDELTTMLDDSDANNVTYAIRQLDDMSSISFSYRGTQDFDRTKVVTAIHKFTASKNPDIAQAAILVVGTHNPYLADHSARGWLITVASADIPGFGKMDPVNNIGGKLYWQQLVSIANSKAATDTRSLAIRALGFVGEKSLRGEINCWLADKEPAVRASATLLLADFPGNNTVEQLTILAKDPAPVVRGRVACTIGILQQNSLIGILGDMLNDSNSKVRETASSSLLSFSPEDPAVEKVFQANLKKTEFHPLFLNALASCHPERYLDELAQVVNEKTYPENFSGGEIPAFTAWKILFKYIQTIPTSTLETGKFDQYLKAVENVGNYSSSNPRDIYAFYILRGMTERAMAFRKKANKAATYDLDYYFKQVDENPSHNSL